MEIKNLQPDQVASLCTLATQTFVDAYRGKISKPDLDTFTGTEFTQSVVTNALETAEIQILWCDNIMVGYIWLQPQQIPVTGFVSERPLYLRRLYFLQNYTGKGYGRALLNSALSFAKRANYTDIWLTVWDKNPRAEAFYQRESFYTVGDCIFPAGSLMCRDLVMVRQLRNGSAVHNVNITT